jgi:hypothetical protein
MNPNYTEKAEESFEARGHHNVLSTHKTTIMITKDENLTKRGDCIVAVNAEKGLSDLSDELKKIIKNEKSKIIFTLEAKGQRIKVNGYGHPDLSLTDPKEIVLRKSNYISNRTLMINANIAASDIPSEFIQLLQTSENEIIVTIQAYL